MRRGPGTKKMLAVPNLNVGLAFSRHLPLGSTSLHMQLPLALSECGPSGRLSLLQTNRRCHCPLHKLRHFMSYTLGPPRLHHWPAHSPSYFHSANNVRLLCFIILTLFFLLYSVCFWLKHSIFCLLSQSRE